MAEINISYAGTMTPLFSGDLKVGDVDVKKIMYENQIVFPAPDYLCSIGDVVIGTQTWMGCNLNVDVYKNGDAIPNITSAQGWRDAEDQGLGAWCYYDNDTNIGRISGKLYNRYALLDPRGIGPDGYHLPTVSEWNTLQNYAGGGSSNIASRKLRSTSFSGGTNETGFSAVPGGYRNSQGTFLSRYILAQFWLSENNEHRTIQPNSPYISSGTAVGEYGFSARLIKD